jgi:hypothetical protein
MKDRNTFTYTMLIQKTVISRSMLGRPGVRDEIQVPLGRPVTGLISRPKPLGSFILLV